MVWARIPSINLVYYDEDLLWELASAIGNPVKVDLHTLKMERGRFARLCVEIDLKKCSDVVVKPRHASDGIVTTGTAMAHQRIMKQRVAKS